MWGCINHEGKQIIPCEYNHELCPIIIEGEVYIPITNRSTGLRGVLNAYGKTIIPCEYKDIEILEYSYPKKYHLLFVQNVNGKWGAINVKGEIVIPIIYDEPQSGKPSNLGLGFFVKVTNGEDLMRMVRMYCHLFLIIQHNSQCLPNRT